MKTRTLPIAMLLLGLFVCAASSAPTGRTSLVEVKSPAPDGFPSLLVNIGADVHTSAEHTADDFVDFGLEKMINGRTAARMGVYFGWVPGDLNLPIGFTQTPAQFAYERAAWFGLPKKAKGQKWYGHTVYLYNSLVAGHNWYIVVISVSGRDPHAVSELTDVAMGMRFKGLELIKDLPAPPPETPAKPPEGLESILLPTPPAQPPKQDSFVELTTSRSTVPSLLVSVGENVETNVRETPTETVFRLQKMANEKPVATMTVSVGNSPPTLGHLVGPASFFQELNSFAYERACWFTWIPKVTRDKLRSAPFFLPHVTELHSLAEDYDDWVKKLTGDGHVHSTVYLYNTLPSGPHQSVVHIMIIGDDRDSVNDFQKIATHMRFKAVDLPKSGG